MDPFKIDDEMVRKLAQLLDETNLSEISYRQGEREVRVARTLSAGPVTVTSPAVAVPADPATVATSNAHPGAVTSPMVGTAHLSPEPGASAYITVGASVAEGDVLLLVEAMKTFNEVCAPRAGKVIAILVDNGDPVEFDQLLLVIE
jgi:acetyl-CoA carboxylase biotin carboxyl carrier protein